ncbi:tryptophan synthase subunit alpha [Propionibacteriaceae bacterium G1746]|uniref:tryptophan synthase subunit alpha n=1 Tax=Aestuariimicrobium sp. G57 TaxID=3418485 RepID=UPI003C2398BF
MSATSSGEAYLKARAEGRGALVGYLPVGFPTVDGSIDAMKAICDGVDGQGVDLVEIGAPYSDPMMDGVTIQHAATRAIERGVRTADVMKAVEAVANHGTQAVVMTYWALVDAYGVERYARDLANAGGSGLITPDLVPDEAEEWIAASDQHGLDRIFLIAPSSTDDRLAMTTAAARGWVYTTAVMGVTGARAQASVAAPELVARARKVTDLPLGVGLGVSNGDQAAQVCSYADGAIVGSALVNCLLENERTGSNDLTKLRELASDLAAGVRRRG